MDAKLVKDIKKLKEILLMQAKRKGLSENFGQEQVRYLKDKYSVSEKDNFVLINDFDEWCQNLEL